MMRMALLAAAAALLCSAALAQPAPEAAPADDQDAFILQIDVGRHGVLIDRAFEGAGVTIPIVFSENGGIGADAPDIWRGLREIGRDGVILKEILCAKGLVGPKTCKAFKAPTWISAQPTPTPSLVTLRTYEEELGAAFGPFVEAGCKAGKRRTQDDMFCSVE